MNRVHQIVLAEIVGLIVLIGLGMLGVTKPSGAVTPVQVVFVGAAAVPAVQATIYSSKTCIPCQRYEKAIKAEMPKDGWIVKDLADKDAKTAHVRITTDAGQLDANRIDATPTTILTRTSDGKVLRRIEGQLTPDHLAELINGEARKLK